MRVVFLGTPQFAVAPLNAIADCHNVVAVVTQPDKPVGRKMVLTPPPVKVAAQERGIGVLQFDRIRNHAAELKSLNADIFITAAYGQILSQEIIDIAPFGIVNIHASILPKYRGAMPVQWAIIKGEKVLGVTTMQTDAGIDTGGTLLFAEKDFGEDVTAGQALEELSNMSCSLILETLSQLQNGLKATPQNHEQSSSYPIIKKSDAAIDFTKTAVEVHNLIRALNPAPIAYAYSSGQAVKIYSARVESMEATGRVGEVNAQNGRLFIQCGVGRIEVLQLQLAGGKRLSAREFLNGKTLVLDI